MLPCGEQINTQDSPSYLTQRSRSVESTVFMLSSIAYTVDMEDDKRHIIRQSAALVLAIIAAYLWLQIPALKPYALQGFSVAIILFFIAKRFTKAKLWHFLPSKTSLQMSFLTFALLLFIGATGNIESLFYPLTYVHLFFLVLATYVPAAIIATVGVVLFHYGLAPSMEPTHIQSLFSLPIMLLIFLFAKNEYDQAHAAQALLEKEEVELQHSKQQQHMLHTFVNDFLKPKLLTLENLSKNPEENSKEVGTQISLLISEIEKVVQKELSDSNQK